MNFYTLIQNEDFWINIISTIIGAILTFIFEKCTQSSSYRNEPDSKISVVQYINISNHEKNNSINHNENVFYFLFGVFSLVYLFNISIFIALFNLIVTVSVFLCIGSLIYKVFFTRNYDHSWIFAIIIHLFFWYGLYKSLSILNIGNPIINELSYILDARGVRGVIKYMSNVNYTIYVFLHLVGVLFFSILSKDIILSVLSLSISRSGNGRFIIWSWKKVILYLIMVTLTYFLISGKVYPFIMEDIPNKLIPFFNRILFGKGT
ncbi:MAG: hypothetical protein SOS93_02460 [Mannheimia varigena]|nr:hypothetical protein [Mannheimia varigena]